MKKSLEKHPSLQEEDLEIQTSDELKEAKRKAGVVSQKESSKIIKELGEETGDRLLAKKAENKIKANEYLLNIDKVIAVVKKARVDKAMPYYTFGQLDFTEQTLEHLRELKDKFSSLLQMIIWKLKKYWKNASRT